MLAMPLVNEFVHFLFRGHRLARENLPHHDQSDPNADEDAGEGDHESSFIVEVLWVMSKVYAKWLYIYNRSLGSICIAILFV